MRFFSDEISPSGVKEPGDLLDRLGRRLGDHDGRGDGLDDRVRAAEEVEEEQPVQLPGLVAVPHHPGDVLVPRLAVRVADVWKDPVLERKLEIHCAEKSWEITTYILCSAITTVLQWQGLPPSAV